LHKTDLSPIKYERVCQKEGEPVDWKDIVKGYEYSKGKFVVLTDEDFKAAAIESSKTIEIIDFVASDEVDSRYFETPYYIAPGKRGQKVYALLRETMLATNRIAVAQVVIRTTQHLAAIVVSGKALMLNTLRYQDELRDATAIDIPAAGLKAAGITSKEVDLAKRLVQDMSGHWNPSDFKDTYHADLMARVKQKIKQGETRKITEPDKSDESPTRTAQVIDLAELLKKSLNGGRAKSTTGQDSDRKSASTRAKPALRVVQTKSGATKTAAKRKRA